MFVANNQCTSVKSILD